MPAFIELVEDTRVFANCKSWKKKYWAKKNDVFVPLCTPKEYNGYDMVPVLGGGAIQADFARPCPAAVAVSRFVSAVCVRKKRAFAIAHTVHEAIGILGIDHEHPRQQATQGREGTGSRRSRNTQDSWQERPDRTDGQLE